MMPIGVTGCTNLIFEVTFWRNLEASFRLVCDGPFATAYDAPAFVWHLRGGR
jgi:hypothetical protein